MTERMHCRVLPHEDADGPANMARDEALLDLAADEPTVAAIRTYGWTEPTLSLGYFQSIAAVTDDPRWRGVPAVRRPTGGGALLHDHEVTYAVVISREHPLARHSVALYRAVHAAIATVLSAEGIAVRRRGEPESGAVAALKPFLCFLDRDPEDLIVGADKIVGSAQRRRSGAVLQHGSLLLSRSPWTPELPGLDEISGTTDRAEARARARQVTRAVAAALELRIVDSGWPDGLLERASRVEREVYRDPRWTQRR